MQHVRYVLPNGGSSPLNCPGQPCLTIDQYTQQTETYFTTGSTFVFLAGNHSPRSKLTLINISDVTLRGEGNTSQVNIICTKDVTIHCDEVQSLSIDELTFVLHSNNGISAFKIYSSNEIQISFSVFQGNGIVLRRAIDLYYSSIEITSCVFNGSIGRNGGAISATHSDITLIESIFVANRAITSGGAIYASGGSITLIETLGNIFMHNSAPSGGAIYCSGCTIGTIRNSTSEKDPKIMHSSLDIIILNHTTYFSNNSAVEGDGGAIHLSGYRSSLSLSGTNNIVFSHNVASHNGGAIYMISRNQNWNNNECLESIL